MKVGRLRAIVKYITENPEHWNQGAWHCGTSHCVAGFCELRAAGYKLKAAVDVDAVVKSSRSLLRRTWAKLGFKYEDWTGWKTRDIAKTYLDLEEPEAIHLFSAARRLGELQEIARTGKFPWQ